MTSKKPQYSPNEKPTDVPPPPPPRKTTHHDCYKSHHECAVAEVERLRKLLAECIEHFRDYEMDVDGFPPNDHKRFICRLKEALDE